MVSDSGADVSDTVGGEGNPAVSANMSWPLFTSLSIYSESVNAAAGTSAGFSSVMGFIS